MYTYDPAEQQDWSDGGREDEYDELAVRKSLKLNYSHTINLHFHTSHTPVIMKTFSLSIIVCLFFCYRNLCTRQENSLFPLVMDLDKARENNMASSFIMCISTWLLFMQIWGNI